MAYFAHTRVADDRAAEGFAGLRKPSTHNDGWSLTPVTWANSNNLTRQNPKTTMGYETLKIPIRTLGSNSP